MATPDENESSPLEQKPSGIVWLKCSHLIAASGLKQALRGRIRVHQVQKPPEEEHPSCIAFYPNGEDIVSEVRRLRAVAPDAAIVVFGASADLPLARAALRAGVSGFLHAEMPPEQIVRALSLAEQGEVVLPRELLNDIVAEECKPDLSVLSPRQLEILELVAEGLSNKQIAKRLWLSMSTIKQHLGGAYKFMGVHNRNQAAVVFRRNKPVEQAGRGDGVKR
jgi:DNA-binding NarL/FixJ family response regulator